MRILVVEDDAKTRAALCRGLREQAWAVDEAGTGEDGLRLAATAPYDAIVLDVMLPGVDGVRACRQLRRSGCTAGILMLTARDAVGDRVTGLDAGADDYLAKPFAFSELLARLRALYRRQGSVRPTEVSLGSLRIDTVRRRASIGGKHLLLSGKEYALLEYLALNAGRIVGRAEISEHVWDDFYDPFSNTIEVHVNRLRRKIGEPGLIVTRRGEGYLLPSEANAEAPR